mmetsp:Transcript_13260/g.43214  ORF Transcript_13260/g.43214 Transcript_13260/m.43214 type:complete len:215 (+) Transcript_13260:614-1258(+)
MDRRNAHGVGVHCASACRCVSGPGRRRKSPETWRGPALEGGSGISRRRRKIIRVPRTGPRPSFFSECLGRSAGRDAGRTGFYERSHKFRGVRPMAFEDGSFESRDVPSSLPRNLDKPSPGDDAPQRRCFGHRTFQPRHHPPRQRNDTAGGTHRERPRRLGGVSSYGTFLSRRRPRGEFTRHARRQGRLHRLWHRWQDPPRHLRRRRPRRFFSRS